MYPIFLFSAPSSSSSFHLFQQQEHQLQQRQHQAKLNHLKALEMWSMYDQQPLPQFQHQSLKEPQENKNYNSLPRQIPKSYQQCPPIESFPCMSISSPSLFETSPESSLTPSPTSTVLNNFE